MARLNMRAAIRALTCAYIITLMAFCSPSFADDAEYDGNLAFSVPSDIAFAMRPDGTLVGPTNAALQNLNSSEIVVSSVQSTTLNGFSFVEDASLANGVNKVQLSFGTGEHMLDASVYVDKTDIDDADAWTIEPGGELALAFFGKSTGVSADIAATAFSFGKLEWFIKIKGPVDPQSGSAYAVLDDDGLLTLFRSNNSYMTGANQSVVDIMGNTYTGHVFSGVETSPETLTGAPWRSRASSVKSVDVASGQVIAPASTAGWFNGCSSMTTCDLNGLDTSSVTCMNGMFMGCSSLASIDVSCLDVSHVKTVNSMFNGCAGLSTLDVSSFDTSSMTSVNSMFYNCSGLAAIDVSTFNTSNVENFGSMFSGCTSLVRADVSMLDTSSAMVTNSMFNKCSALTTVDMGGFAMSKVEDAYGMFYYCERLKTIYVDSGTDWSSAISDSTNCNDMFCRCVALVGGAGTAYASMSYSPSIMNKTYARVDGLGGKPGYFTEKTESANTNNKTANTVSPAFEAERLAHAYSGEIIENDDSPGRNAESSDVVGMSEIENDVLSCAAPPARAQGGDVVPLESHEGECAGDLPANGDDRASADILPDALIQEKTGGPLCNNGVHPEGM